MAFDVKPAPVRRRGQRFQAIAVLVVGIGLVAIAIATANPAPQHASATAASSDSAAAALQATPGSRTDAPATDVPGAASMSPGVRRRLPQAIDCHGLDRATCDTVAAASVAIMPADAAVIAIDAWSSILCGDTLDCPPQRLAAATPLGSAVVTLAGGGTPAWVNVIEPSPAAGSAAGSTVPIAWIVRSRP